MTTQEITPLVFILDNLNKAVTPIASFLSNVSNALEDDTIEADWTPAQHDIVLFLAEDGTWQTGSYQNIWAAIRPLRFEGDSRTENFEASPYHNDGTIMAKVNHANRNDKNEWEIDYTFSFVDIGNILPFDASNTEYALLSNQAHAKRVAMDMAVAS